MIHAHPYVISAAEPGAQLEFYLPKKSVYQGRLYDTLTRGFDIEHVRDHFRDPAKRPRIEALLAGHGFASIEPERIEQTYWGYSLYEVDGVFKTTDPRRAGQIDEERVQVFRILFRPDMDTARRIQPDAARLRQLIDALTARGSAAPGDLSDLSDLSAVGPLSPEDRAIIDLMTSFTASLRLFIVGYLLFETCDQLWELNQRTGQKLEDEIWVTMTPGLMINRFLVPGQSGG